jgi:hypothetical protein
MADDLCTAEVNGTTLTCACAGCGIAYDHDSGQYTILCCRVIVSTKAEKDQGVEPDPSKRHHIEIDLSGATRLEAAQLLHRLAPGKIRIDGSLESLQERVTLKESLPLEELIEKLRIQSTTAK